MKYLLLILFLGCQETPQEKINIFNSYCRICKNECLDAATAAQSPKEALDLCCNNKDLPINNIFYTSYFSCSSCKDAKLCGE
jgi:hypothetical protein